jgi:hypothetical protein
VYRDAEGNSMPNREKYRDELIGRLRVLRADIDVIIDHYRMNCISRVEEMLRILEHRDTIAEDSVEPTVDNMRKMLSQLDDLKVKPKKGRLKDLKRIDALLEQLLSKFPTQL